MYKFPELSLRRGSKFNVSEDQNIKDERVSRKATLSCENFAMCGFVICPTKMKSSGGVKR